MAQIHATEQPVTLQVYPEIWGDMRSIVIDRLHNDRVMDSMIISSESEAEEFVSAFLRSMSTLEWCGD